MYFKLLKSFNSFGKLWSIETFSKSKIGQLKIKLKIFYLKNSSKVLGMIVVGLIYDLNRI